MTVTKKFPIADDGPWGIVIATLSDEEQVERFVAQLPKEQVVAFTLRAEQIKKAAAMAQKMGESRIVGDQILGGGELYEDETGREWMWTGDRKREVKDPAGLKAALESIVAVSGILAQRAFKAAFKPMPDKVYLTELDRISKFAPEAEDIVRDFATWTESAPHLRPVEEKGK